MSFVIIHDGIQQLIFQRASIFLLPNEHREVVILAVESPVQRNDLRPWWYELLQAFE
jgi:hypothetical protein